MLNTILADHPMRGAAESLAMQAVTVDGCFGWLHARVGAPASDTAVLICSGLTHDRLSGHRSLRQFADVLASNDYPTLRFDYPDTGDAADIGEAEHWSRWQRSVTALADWLRDHTGARRVVFVGVRIGAMLAALAAQGRDDVAGLLLFEPTLRGKPYIRQLLFARYFRDPPPLDGDGRLDLHGLALSGETISQIGQVELHAIRPPPACPVAVFCQSPSPVLTKFVEAWRSAGAKIVSEDFAGLEPLLRPTFMNHEPSADFSRPLAWLRQNAPATALPFVLAPAPSCAPLRGEHWVETPYRFGDDERLVGVLCRPAADPAADRIVVIVNSSGNPHDGDNRQVVGLARRLASEGLASLRMDFAGIGDSLSSGADPEAPTHIMETDRTVDVSAALDALQSDGFRHFAIHGLCSGAYHAMHGALADRRLTAMLLVNMPVFTWRKGNRVETMTAAPSTQYLRRLALPLTWTRFLQGKLDLAFPAYRLRTASATSVKAAMRHAIALLGRVPRGSFAQRAMADLSRRGVRMQLLYASADVGVEVLRREFGRHGRGLRDADIQYLPELDHSLSRAEMRRLAEDRMVTFLKQTWHG